MPVYNKLVRDRIPEIIQQDGQTLVTRVLSDEEYEIEVQRKMHEELAEYEEAVENKDKLEELADLLELIHVAAAIQGATFEELEEVRAKKAETRGGFEKRIYLVDVKDD